MNNYRLFDGAAQEVGFLPISQSLGGIEIYPGPNTEQYRSSLYTVEVLRNDQYYNTYVYVASGLFWQNAYQAADTLTSALFAISGTYPPVSFVTFGCSGTTTVRVSKRNGQNINSIDIGPYRLAKTATITNNQATFQVSKNENLWIVIDNSVSSPLFISADPPKLDVPATLTTHVNGATYGGRAPSLYFGPGVYDIGQKFQVSSGCMYYLDGGAYVRGSFDLSGQNDVSFVGPGVLSLENFDWWGAIKDLTSEQKLQYTAFFTGSSFNYYDGDISGNSVSGLTLIRAPFYASKDSFKNVYNFKFLSPWNYNTDGIKVGSRMGDRLGVMKNTVMFAGDDLLFPQGSVNEGNCLYENIYLGALEGAPITTYYPTYTFNGYFNLSGINIDIKTFQFSGYDPVKEVPKNSIFKYLSDGYAASPTYGIDHHTWINVNVENYCYVPLFMFDNRPYPFGTGNDQYGITSAITLSGVYVTGNPTVLSSNIIQGLNTTQRPSNLTFTDVSINGTYIKFANRNNYVKWVDTFGGGNVTNPSLYSDVNIKFLRSTAAKYWVKIAGTWREAIPWVKKGSTWEPSDAFVKDTGTWK